jgi:hypothetical protein
VFASYLARVARLQDGEVLQHLAVQYGEVASTLDDAFGNERIEHAVAHTRCCPVVSGRSVDGY